jgi:hypothetical protein
MLKIQAMTEEVREEEKKLPTKEELQEILERVASKLMRRIRQTETLTGEFMNSPRGNPGMTIVRRRRRVRFLARGRAEL